MKQKHTLSFLNPETLRLVGARYFCDVHLEKYRQIIVVRKCKISHKIAFYEKQPV